MKSYKLEILDNMTKEERLEALEKLGISTPDILDYLIKSHERAIGAGVVGKNFLTESNLNCWKNLVVHLKAARSLFHA